MDLIFYALGGELQEWTEHQLLCTGTLIEVDINNKVLSLSRDITETGKAPMFFFEGPVEDALGDSVSWFKYPNARSADKHSYSQQLFELLGLPRHKTDDAKNLTMHQILRLMYVDQMSSTMKLLREEKQHDSPIMRRAIGEYMLGIDDLEAHNLRQSIIDANKYFESVDGELKAIYRVLGDDAAVLQRQALLNAISEAESSLAELEVQRSEIRSRALSDLEESVQERLSELRDSIRESALAKADFEQRHSDLTSELVDTKLFLESVRFRLRSIHQSKSANVALGAVEFKYCPACLSPIQASEDDAACCLCKTEIPKEHIESGYVQVINELNFQIRESEGLIVAFEQDLQALRTQIQNLESRIREAKWEYSELAGNASTADAALSEISAEIGFQKSQIVNLNEKLEFVGQVERLIDEKVKANAQLTRLKDRLKALEESTATRYQQVYARIEETARDFLLADGGYEGAFNNPEEVDFDFARDRMSVNGRTKFSASSMVVMKNSIRAAIFAQSILDSKSRFPSLFLMDNIEDKGMTEVRSQNYQTALVEYFSNYDPSEYQLIFTTSMIAQDLNNETYTIGDFYPKGAHTLAIG